MIDRRNFLAASGALTVTFLTGCALPVIPKRPAPKVDDALSWVSFANGRYTLFIPRVEMGQNILTALKQVACEELAIAWNQLDAKLPSTTQISRVRATVGSESVKDFFVPLAQACATLRDAIKNGNVSGIISAEPRPIQSLKSFLKGGLFVGLSPELEQAKAMVTGQPLYCADIRRPGQVFGTVLRAPVAPELKSIIISFNESAAKLVPGFIQLVRSPLLSLANSEGIGLVARTPNALALIETALAVQWEIEGGFEQSDIDTAIDIDRRLSTQQSLSNKIHRDAIEQKGNWDIDLRIDIPLAAHAAIEPRAAVAEFSNDGKLQVWVGTQDVFYQRDVISRRMGIDENLITVHGQRVGGAFGGKTICTVELEACVLARDAKLPVKVQWRRAQELQFGFHRPPSSHRIRARIKNGQLDEWWHAFASSHILFTNAIVPPWLQKLTNIIGDDGVARGATLNYNARAKRCEFDLVRLPVFTGPWRGLGAGPNGLAIESAIDACAKFANIDPIKFRLDSIVEPRLARVLERVAQISNWQQSEQQPQDKTSRRGMGVACGTYKAMSYAAVVAQVDVDISTGQSKVLRLWCVHDCGLVINPDQVKAQCEGNLVWGIGMVFIDNLPVSQSKVTATTFADAPIALISDVPNMEISLIDEGEAPSGAGETAIVAAAAAIANAIHQATGVRIKQFPVSPAVLMSSPR
jgi:isoquinoline 1-oxidoreductase subunit beta